MSAFGGEADMTIAALTITIRGYLKLCRGLSLSGNEATRSFCVSRRQRDVLRRFSNLLRRSDPIGLPQRRPRKGRSLRVDRDGQLFDGSEARPLPPTNGVRRHGQLELRPAFEEGLQRAFSLNTGELVA
jgi:hypothetical protein